MSGDLSSAAGRRFGLAVKRATDVALALAGLALAWPLLLAAALAIRVSMGSPVLFRQRRPGRHEIPFVLFKLRTMQAPSPADERAWFRSDADRLTPLGRFLQRWSIDELPQLWNVVRGEMSLVGPRPLLMEYLPRYSAEQRRRHRMRPGLTGLAVVEGRRRLPFSRRLRLDTWYVDHWSLGLDARILARTVLALGRGRGVIPDQELDEVDDLALAPDRDGAAGPPAASAAGPPGERALSRGGARDDQPR